MHHHRFIDQTRSLGFHINKKCKHLTAMSLKVAFNTINLTISCVFLGYSKLILVYHLGYIFRIKICDIVLKFSTYRPLWITEGLQ